VGLAEANNATSDDKQSPSLTSLMQLFHRGDFDLIALGRVLLTDPAWPTKVRNRQLDQIRQYNKTDARRLY
jgi:2,4-dienoyl-CoA reductase-like NADH-dependent reductase (Old Yellow Enzyme family)